MVLNLCQMCKYQNDTEFDACHICNNEKDMFRPRPTNADRIRAMTDEELAEWIVRITEGNGFDGYEERVKAWLKWLKQEAQDEID